MYLIDAHFLFQKYLYYMNGGARLIKERNIDELISEYMKIHHGNPIRAIWNLVDLMKESYETSNLEDGRLFYESIVSMFKDELASE